MSDQPYPTYRKHYEQRIARYTIPCEDCQGTGETSPFDPRREARECDSCWGGDVVVEIELEDATDCYGRKDEYQDVAQWERDHAWRDTHEFLRARFAEITGVAK